MSNHNIVLDLTPAEGLVLFELLTRIDSKKSVPLEDEAEQTVLWKLEAQLEKILTAPLAPDYHDQLARARQQVRGSPE
jgi:hypothetical protein